MEYINPIILYYLIYILFARNNHKGHKFQYEGATCWQNIDIALCAFTSRHATHVAIQPK